VGAHRESVWREGGLNLFPEQHQESNRMTTPIHLLCAGAAKGLVLALQAEFEATHDAKIEARYGAVGALKEALVAGAPCDLMVVTASMVNELSAAGWLTANSTAALGRVRTGMAVRAGASQPDVATPDALRAVLLAANGIYFPDPARATAGIHFAEVMRQLGIHDQVAPQFRTFPNGATAMHELATSTEPNLIGCTQITEINYTPGLSLLGALPDKFELATLYSGAVGAKSTQPGLALALLKLLSGDASKALRLAGGFEF
jgi:molybdate transport system substrate-binding protein